MWTQDLLDKLKVNYASGVLRVREGDSWLEYQTSDQMLEAINRIEAELERTAANQVKPRGSRLVKVSKSNY